MSCSQDELRAHLDAELEQALASGKTIGGKIAVPVRIDSE